MSGTVNRLGVETLSVIGMPPHEFVSLAADAGCAHVSLRTGRRNLNPFGFEDWSLVSDAALRRETLARMVDRGISVSLGEGFPIRPGLDVEEYARDIEIFEMLGVRRINTVSMDPDEQRTRDQVGKLSRMARDADMELLIEFVPGLAIDTLDRATSVIRDVGEPGVKVLIDIMHFVRAGHHVDRLAALDPAMFGYIQICDAPLVGSGDYLDEAMHQRRIPGEGEMPVREIIAALAGDLIVSMEVPLRDLAQAGVPHVERVRRAADASRAILAEIADC